MRARQRPSEGLLELAWLQGRVLSNEQIVAHGLSLRSVERLVAEGSWRRLATNLVQIGPDAPDWTALAWGGILLGGDRSRLGGTAAGHVWKLAEEPNTITVLVPADRVIRPRQNWRFVRERPGLRRPSRGSPPRTCVEDTVIDMSQELDEAAVIDLTLKAIQQRLTRPELLTARLSCFVKARHRRLLEQLLVDAADGVESPLELAYRDVERRHGLPRGERQSRAGRAVHDVRYRPYATVVELDGRLGHEGLGRFRDMRRDNSALVRGEVTLRYGWTDVHEQGCFVARQVGSILMTRGWDGPPVTCSRCRNVSLSDLGVR